MTTVTDRIKKIREGKNYTQEYVAGKLSISQNTYSKLEGGNIKLTTDRLKEIAEILQVPIEELLTGETQTYNFNNSHIEKFYGYIENLQEDNKENLRVLHEQIAYLQKENERLLTMVEKLVGKQP
jgi:transcriptional regulator with XRE-family HTH domain